MTPAWLVLCFAGTQLMPQPWLPAPTGVGSEHAKWSPVATAWYRLHPELVILQVWLPPARARHSVLCT